MDKITSPPPHPGPFCDPEGYDKGMDRAPALLQKGCDALDDGRFWAGVALGFTGSFRGFGTILCHPVDTTEDLCTPDEDKTANASEDASIPAEDGKQTETAHHDKTESETDD